jgi:serine/threonine protein kinase
MSEEVFDTSANTRKFIHYPIYVNSVEQPHRLYPLVDIAMQIMQLGAIIIFIEFMMVVCVPGGGVAETGIFMALSIPFALYFLKILLRSARISVSESGISYPLVMAPYLQGRLFRPWSDLQSIDLHEAKDHLNYIRGNVLTMTFGSGGSVEIDTTRIPREDLRILQENLGKYTQTKVCFPASAELVSRNDLELSDSQMFVFSKKHRSLLSNSFGLTNHILSARSDSILGGDFIIQEAVAGSASRCSYLANDVSGARLVLLTEYDLSLVDDNLRAEVANELQVQSERFKNLHIPGLLNLLDVRVMHDKFYTVMEPKAQSLRAFVQKDGSFSEKKVCSLALKLAETLEQFQSRNAGLSLGGIKPDAISYTREGSVTISEFGFVDDVLMNYSNAVLVDAPYAAPERLSECVQPESDLYSIGATMYFALTGQDPIAYTSSEVRARQSNVTAETSNLVERLLNVDPAQRGTVRDLMHALGGFDRIGTAVEKPPAVAPEVEAIHE